MASTEVILNSAHEYDLILTHSDVICERAANAKLFQHGECWVAREDAIADERVTFIFSEGAVSSVLLPGYDTRAAILAKAERDVDCGVQVYYGTRRPMRETNRAVLGQMLAKGLNPVPLTSTKLPALKSRYQIVVENFPLRNWFTEKIVDCFARKVTPIYIGCPNIGDFFDQRGVLQCANVDEVFAHVHAIMRGEKLHHTEASDINFELAAYYGDVSGRFRAVVEDRMQRRR